MVKERGFLTVTITDLDALCVQDVFWETYNRNILTSSFSVNQGKLARYWEFAKLSD